MQVAGKRRRRVVPAVAAIAVVLFLAATARLFVWPPTDAPAHADAVVSLGGDPGQRRAQEAVSLLVAGWARVALVSLGGYRVPCPAAPAGTQVVCFRPDPVDTRGEAEYAARYAGTHHWSHLVVVPERSQSTRARMLFERCTTVRLTVVPVADRPGRLLGDVVYEWGALLKALVLKRAC